MWLGLSHNVDETNACECIAGAGRCTAERSLALKTTTMGAGEGRRGLAALRLFQWQAHDETNMVPVPVLKYSINTSLPAKELHHRVTVVRCGLTRPGRGGWGVEGAVSSCGERPTI